MYNFRPVHLRYHLRYPLCIADLTECRCDVRTLCAQSNIWGVWNNLLYI